MYNVVYLLILFLIPEGTFGQFSIKIKAIDSLNSDQIANVSIFLNDSFIGNTNNYGYLNKSTISNICQLKLTHLSFEDKTIICDVTKGEIMLIKLQRKSQLFQGFKLKGNKAFNRKFGETIIPISYLKKIPYIFGELDALKAIQTFPGVTSSYEANSSVYIRGGNIDQTSIFLDDAPIYNIGHFYGFFSPFDGEALKSFTLINSGIYSGFGSRGSSILDVRFREGNMNKHEGLFSLGFISSKILIEGPILTNKLSYLTSIRFAYPGTFLNFKFNNNFIDGNTKIKYIADSFNTFYASIYVSKDIFSLEGVNEYTIGNANIDKFEWGNKTTSIRWNHIASSGVSINTVTSYSKFNSRAFFVDELEPDFGNEIKNYSLKIEFDNLNSLLKKFRFGFSSNYYLSNPAVLYYHRADTTPFQQSLLPLNQALETCLFGENSTQISKLNIDIISNLRLGFYHNLEDHYMDPILEPRIKIIKHLRKHSMFASFDKNSQYQSYVGNKQIAVPSDYWIQASKLFKAQKIFAYAVGITRPFKLFTISNELFFKDYNNALDIKNGGNTFRNKQVLDDILNVKAIAYGSEFLLEKHQGKIQGHLSYTLSRSIRKSIYINNNEWFAANFDRTHMFNMSINYKPNKKWLWGVLGIIQSGTPVTANYAYSFLYSLRNEYRLPIYYRIDFTVTKSFTIAKKTYCEWNLSVFNATYAKNRTSQFPAFNSFGSLPPIPSFSFKVFI